MKKIMSILDLEIGNKIQNKGNPLANGARINLENKSKPHKNLVEPLITGKDYKQINPQKSITFILNFINAHLLVLFYLPALICAGYYILYYSWPGISAAVLELNHSQLQSCKDILLHKKFSMVEEYINCVQSLKRQSSSPMGLLSKHIDCQLLLQQLNNNKIKIDR